VAVIAGVISYAHIEGLALAVHQTVTTARLLPFSVDFLIVAGSVILLAGSWLGWLGVVPGVAATAFANVESGLPHGGLAATVAGWPAAAFTVASFMLERWLKAQASQGGNGGSGWHDANAASADFASPPEPVLATPEPPGPPASQCGHTVAGTPEENVVRAYLHERDCLGEKPSQRRLSATYGVSRPRVAQIVGNLNGQQLQDTGEPPPDN
jgi:hypothetical protein